MCFRQIRIHDRPGADTLNFVFVAPELTGVTLAAEVNPTGPGQLPESDYSNNGLTLVVDFICKGIPEVLYVPIDYRPSGGPTPNLPDPALIEPGVGDNFIQAIFPGKYWEYRPADVPSKLWTSSLSGTGSSAGMSSPPRSSRRRSMLALAPKPAPGGALI